jgi:type I restriction enzyme R subunit
MAKLYYTEFKKQLSETNNPLTVATIFSYSPNEEDPGDGPLPDEDIETGKLDKSSRDFLDDAIKDYNKIFKVNFDTSSDKFQNYYKDVSLRVKNREIDILIVVNMFLTGFDATTLNTLWVDKNLRSHGLIQAFSRTNRILNSVKTFGNIVCFRDLQQATDEAVALFGDKEACGIVLLKTYNDYYDGYDDNDGHIPGYTELIADLAANFPIGQPIISEEAKKGFIRLYGKILKTKNILNAFDEFAGNEILSERDFQDYQSLYIDMYQDFRKTAVGDKEDIIGDIVFELELIRQIEVNIDYILLLVAKYHESNCADKGILGTIDKAVSSSMQLRSKKELIQRFIEQVNTSTEIDDGWRKFVQEKKEEDLAGIIADENLKPEETRRFIDNSFRDGALKTTGTDIDKILPPTSRFKDDRSTKKQNIIDKLLQFFEKFFGLA